MKEITDLQMMSLQRFADFEKLLPLLVGFSFPFAVEKPVQQELDLNLGDSVRSACQKPIPVKPALEAAATRSRKSKLLYSRSVCG